MNRIQLITLQIHYTEECIEIMQNENVNEKMKKKKKKNR